jgi:hypothetical protein
MLLKTNLTIVFAIWLVVSLINGVASLLTVFSYWRVESEPDQRKRKIMASSSLSSFMMMIYTLSSLVVVVTNDSALTGVIMTSWAYSMWFFLLVGAGAVAFALAKFFRLYDNCTWVFTISTALSFGLLGAATILSVTPAFRDVRWVMFAASCALLLLALIIILFADKFFDPAVKNSGVADPPTECERGFRTMLRLWIAITWILVPVAWILGVFGIGNIATSNHTFEQSSYLLVTFLALVAPIFLILLAFNPDTSFVGKQVSRAGNVVNNASHSAMAGAHSRAHSHNTVHIVRTGGH